VALDPGPWTLWPGRVVVGDTAVVGRLDPNPSTRGRDICCSWFPRHLLPVLTKI
jgi:hypothetical protein